MISKSNIVVFFAYLFYQRLYLFYIHAEIFLLYIITYDSVLAFSPMQSHNPHTFVVITLDPPIRKGQTLYPHIVIQVPYHTSIFT